MKKLVIAMMMVMALTAPAAACPQWECQLMPDDWSCGGVHGSCSGQPVYDENTAYTQYIYCPYCGHEMWDCVCSGVAYNNDECDYAGDYCDYQGGGSLNYNINYNNNYCDDCLNYTDSYSCGSGSTMSHWANIRDCAGNIIGQVGAGSSVEVCGTDPSNPERVLIYDYSTGNYGSVLSECVYGGYQWDGSGDNGYYNQYNGGCDENYSGYVCDTAYSGDCYNGSSDCTGGYADCSASDSGCGSYGSSGCYDLVRYTEVIQIVRNWEMATGCVRTCW